MWELCVRFFTRLEIKKVASKKLSQVCLKHTTKIQVFNSSLRGCDENNKKCEKC